MRTNITISLDPKFIERMDARRGSLPRSRWLEAAADPDLAAPVLRVDSEPARGSGPLIEPEGVFEAPELDRHGNPAGTVYDETDPRSWT